MESTKQKGITALLSKNYCSVSGHVGKEDLREGCWNQIWNWGKR